MANIATQKGPLIKYAPFLGLTGLILTSLLFLWLFQSVVLPFILGAVVAYMLDPMVEWLDRFHRIPRRWAVLTILLLFLTVLGGILGTLLPLAYHETVQFLDNVPQIIERLHQIAEPYLTRLRGLVGLHSQEELTALLGENWQKAFDISGSAASTLKNAGQSLVSLATLPIFVVIIAYFMLKEWPDISKWITDMIPRPYLDDFKKLKSEINTKLSGFIRGQILVMVILSIGYSIALSIAGLNYGILIGIMSGLLSIIPLVGSTIGLLASVLIAYMQEGNLTYPAIIAAIFLAGQLIEGNVITPYVVGESVGLHPLWIFFALLAGGAMLGIVGMLISVPVAAIISVLSHYFIKKYKDSSFYKGTKQTKDLPKKG